MAQVGVQYPNLNEMFGSNSVFPTHFGLQREDLAQRSTKINQDQALQDMFDQEQSRAGKLREQELKNLMDEARLPGIGADSSMRTRANTVEGIVGADKMAAGKTADINEKLSKEEASQIEKHASELLRSQDPKARAMGRQIMTSLPDFIKDDIKQEAMTKRQLQTIAASGAEARKTQQQAIDAGKFVKSAGNGGTSAAQAKLEMNPEYWFNKADAATDPQEKDYFQTKGENAFLRAQALRAAATAQGQQGKPDLAGMGVPTVPREGPQIPSMRPVPPPPGSAPLGPGAMAPQGPTVASKGPTTPIHLDWIKRMKAKYPDKSDQEIIQFGQKLGKFN